MNHKFYPSAFDPTKCGFIIQSRHAMCGYTELSHGDEGKCDSCNYVGEVEVDTNGDLACPECITKVIKKIPVSDVLKKNQEIHESLKSFYDYFNIDMVPISQLVKAVDEDESIKNKPLTKCELLLSRINKGKELIFNVSKVQQDLNKLREQEQIALNLLMNQLKTEERLKFSEYDINYKPAGPKEIKARTEKKETIKKITVKKVDKAEVRKAANESGIPEYLIQIACNQKGISPADAVILLSKSGE